MRIINKSNEKLFVYYFLGEVSVSSCEFVNAGNWFPVSQACDGNLNTMGHSSPNVDTPELQLVIPSNTEVAKVVIYNRMDSCCVDRISPFTIKVNCSSLLRIFEFYFLIFVGLLNF